MEKETIHKNFCITVAAVALFAFFFGVHSAFAATLLFSPQSGTYFAGRSFSVVVEVSSPGEAINAVQGEVSFPTNDLEVLSVSKANSVLNLWVQDPTFSNQNGTVDFAGVVVNPGFEGSNANIITITFEAKNTGNAPLSINSASVLANDGSGTNILTTTKTASFAIASLSPVPSLPSAGEISNVPPKTSLSTVITSNPLVTRGEWYNFDQITFDWSVPADADGVDYTISNNANLQLPDVNQGLISQTSYDLSNFADGVWYFFVSFESGNSWSPPVAESFMLDRTPPDLFVIAREDPSMSDTQPVFTWVATDQTSGIDHYEVKIGDGDWFNPASLQNGSSSYVLPPQSPTGGRSLTVRAFDKAGNHTDASIAFRVLAPGAPCMNLIFSSCVFSEFFAEWGWLVMLIFIIFLIVSWGFIYHLLRWKDRSWKALKKLEDILGDDLKEIERHAVKDPNTEVDFSKPPLLDEQRELEKDILHVADDVKEGIDTLEK